MNAWGRASKRRQNRVNKDLVKCATVSVMEMTYSDMTVPWMGGYRNASQQLSIFNAGNSQLDGYKKKSYHQSGNALDVVPYKSKNDTISFYMFAALMFKNWQKYRFKGELQWGGHWKKFVDLPHWQVYYPEKA